MSSLSPYPLSSSVHTMNNHHPHHHNYGGDGRNGNYSVQHQLSENSVHVNNESSSSSSCLLQGGINDYYGEHPYHRMPSRNVPLYSHPTHHLYQDNPNHLYRYNVLPSSSTSNSCGYPCHNGSNVNYNEQNNLSICSNNVSQSEMINSNHPMNIDLYGLSLSPSVPPTSSSLVPSGSSSSPPTSSIDHSINPNSSELSSLTTSVDSISKQQTPPVIYPWMRKVHMNNPG